MSTEKKVSTQKVFTFDINAVKNSTQSKNFDYTKLYRFIADQKNKTFLDKTEKKELRKKVQSSTLDSNFIGALIMSGFVTDNKSKDKYIEIKTQVETFEKTFTIK